MEKIELTTHDNWRQPYRLIINGNSIAAYLIKNDIIAQKPIVTIDNFEKMFIGIDKFNRAFSYGNTVLVKIDASSITVNVGNFVNGKNNYVSIGNGIYHFTTDDEIIGYYSYIGNNDSPYHYAIGVKNTYFLAELKYVKNKDLGGGDLYRQLYDNKNIISYKFDID